MNKKIGKELRSIRKFRNLTLRELGEKTSISYSRLGKFEGGKETPTNEAISRIEKVLNVNFNDYFKVAKSIDAMFDEFLDSLFYYDDNMDLFKTRIANGKANAIINFSFGKVQLMEYIMLVLDNEFDKAKLLEAELIEYFSNNFELLALIYQYKGLTCRILKQYEKAIFYFEKAEIMTIKRKRKGMLHLHSSIAYKNYGNVTKAIHNIRLAHKIFSEFGSLRRVAFSLVEYGLLLKANQEYNQAIHQFNIALRALEMIDCSETLIAIVNSNMCWTMILSKDYQSALTYLEEVAEIESKSGFTVLYAIWCYYKLGNYAEAERWISGNQHLHRDNEFAKFYDLFALLVKNKDNIPSNKLISSAIKIIDDFKDGEDYERINFYIDIVLDLLNRSDRELEKIKYLEMKVNLTKKW